MQSRRGLRFGGAWLVWMGGASTCGGGLKCRVGVACVWRGRG